MVLTLVTSSWRVKKTCQCPNNQFLSKYASRTCICIVSPCKSCTPRLQHLFCCQCILPSSKFSTVKVSLWTLDFRSVHVALMYGKRYDYMLGSFPRCAMWQTSNCNLWKQILEPRGITVPSCRQRLQFQYLQSSDVLTSISCLATSECQTTVVTHKLWLPYQRHWTGLGINQRSHQHRT